MLTLMDSSLFRFLLSLVIRLRRSVGRLALALRARFGSLWNSILTFAHRRDQSQIRLHASNVPVVDISQIGRRPQIPEPAKVEDENRGTLAALPVRGIAHSQNELSKYQALTSSYRSNSDALPATPERGSQRYKRRPDVSQSSDPLDIPAGQQTLLSALPRLPDGWRRHVHPEGNPFFYHEGLRIFTESDIVRRETEILFYATTLIQQAKQNGKVILDELIEIVLNVDDSQRWHYYFVDHRNRLLFWLESVSPREDLGTDVQGISEYNHIRYLVEAQYWYASRGLGGMSAPYTVYNMESRSHCEYYPHGRVLPQRVFEDLRGMLNYAKTDMMTTDSSSSPFAPDELVAILDLVNSLKDDENISNPYSIWVIARLMAFFTENQFLNFCGQSCARLNADTPLFGQQTWNRSKVFTVVNVFLFGSANDHAVRLQRVWVDGIIIQPRWKDFISRLTAELGRYTIFSTVMLAVNFSFLAVPGVVTVGSPASVIQIVIYCSVVLTIGSIVFSFGLLNVYSDPGLMVAGPAAEAMRTLGQTKWGMACLAITHSLPIASLVWSIALFSMALAVQIFRPKERPTYVTLGAECLILVLLGLMSASVMRLFSRSEDVDDSGVEVSEEKTPSTGSQHDVEEGLGKCCIV